MRKLRSLIVSGALAGMFLAPVQSDAGVRVTVRLGPPKLKHVRVVKPRKPYRNAVWVSGHWKYVNGRYVYVRGSWVRARRGHVYVQAVWVRSPRGYCFVPGHWVKK